MIAEITAALMKILRLAAKAAVWNGILASEVMVVARRLDGSLEREVI